MKKSTYLTILLILMLDCWNIIPFGNLNRNLYLGLEILFIIWGFISYPNRRFSLFQKNLLAFWLIALAIAFSMLPALIFYKQSIPQSIITYRVQILWSVIPLLFYIKVSLNDILRSTTIMTVVMCGVWFLKFFLPDLFVLSEKEMLQNEMSESSEYFVAGVSLVVIPLSYHLQKIRKSINKQSIGVILICILFIYLIQNRSTLFPSIIITVLAFASMKSKYKKLILFVSVIVLVILFVLTVQTWISLFDETLTQMTDEDYNRNKAYVYFLSPLANPNWFTYIFGNGFLSAHATPLMIEMMEEGVYNSDVGYIGFWNQFGVLPIIVFIALSLRPFVKWRNYSYCMKSNGFFMIMTSMTIGYYASPSALCYFALYYYLLFSPFMQNIIFFESKSRCNLLVQHQ